MLIIMFRIRKTYPIILWLVFAVPHLLTSQSSDIRFHNIGLQDGLSHTLVSDMVEDDLGFLWFATQEGLNRYDEAITAYERSAELFAQAGEGDLRSMVMKSAAAIKLKTGKITDSAFKMMGSLDVKENPSFFERILKFFLRFIK